MNKFDDYFMIIYFCRRVLLLACLLVCCAGAYAQKTPSSFLWRISGNGLGKPSFLYGTIHLNDKRLFYFGDSLYRYLEQAEGFHMEIDPDSMMNAALRRWSQPGNGRLLKSLMQRKEYEKYANKLAQTLGKPADKITTRDVWMAKNRQTAEAYQKGDMSSFMDLYLYGIAQKQGKLVGGIEDVEDQLNVLDDLFDEMDLAYLTQDSTRQAGADAIEQMKQIYLKQDLDGIESFTTGLTSQKFKDVLLMRRNMKMARRMDSLARRRSSFFAVGVAHLPGDTGVIDLLRKRGFVVEPVFSSKKISPENYTYKTVEKPWITFTHDLNLYHVETPGALQPLDVMKEVMDMKFYYDMASGKAYYTAVVNSVAGTQQKDSLFAAMISRMTTGERSLVSQKNIAKQGWEGRDVVMKVNADQLTRLQVYLADGYVFMAMMLTKKTELFGADAKRFFDSFTMTPAASITRPYINYRDSVQAFSILLPYEPSVHEQTEQEEGGDDIKVFTATDYSSGNTYAITVRNRKAGGYISTDTSYLEQVKRQLTGIMKEDTASHQLPYQGYPSLQMNGSAKAENAYYQTLLVLRGNRSYFLIAQLKGSKPARALADSFLHSFRLNSYSRGDWQIRKASDSTFALWAPPASPAASEEGAGEADTALADTTALDREASPKNEFIFQDKATNTSYHVQREHYSPYYYSRNDSSFFSQAADDFKTEGDSITRFRLLTIGSDKAADVQLEHPYSSIVKKLRFILHGDTLYKVFTYTPRLLLDHENTRQFFSRFSLASTAPATTLFINKTAQLVADLGSADSTTFSKASDYLYDAELQHADLAAFYPLLIKPLKDFSDEDFDTNDELIRSIAPIADTATVDFVRLHYPTLQGASRKLQYPLLKLLVKMRRPYATESVIKIFNKTGPPAGDPGGFALALNDSLPLARTLFPTIMQLTKDTSTALEWAYLCTQLLDSNYISKQDVLPYLDNFIAAAAGQKKGLGKEDDNYALSDAIDLFGKLNSKTTNTKLQEYSRLPNPGISYQAICWLINNKQPLPAQAINKLAGLDEYRTFIYDTLKTAGKAGMFPAAQLSQKLFAASYMRSWIEDEEDDEELTAVQRIGEKIALFNGKKQKFYLFKISYGEGEGINHRLGIAGPFSLTASPVTSKNEATGLYWQESFSTEEINNQFKAYLAEWEQTP